MTPAVEQRAQTAAKLLDRGWRDAAGSFLQHSSAHVITLCSASPIVLLSRIRNIA
jgi:hypothetical protein